MTLASDPQQAGKTIVILASNAAEGGTVNYTNALTRTLEQAGYIVHRVALYRHANWDREGFEHIVMAVDEPSVGQLVAGSFKLMGVLRRLHPDIVLGVKPMANVLAGFATFAMPVVAVPTHHSPYESDGRVVRWLDWLLGSMGRYRKIVSVSNAVDQSYARHPAAYRRRSSVILNGIPTMEPDGGRGSIRERYGVAPDRKFVLMAGRLADQKNVLRAAEAMALVPEADFLLSGRGPQEAELRELIASHGMTDRVRLIGLVDKQDLTNLMYECDAFLQVSLFEGQSVALLEAAAAGAALVVSAIPTQIEVITTPDGPAGLTCDPQSPEDMARAIRAALFDAGTRAMIMRNARHLRANVRTEAETHGEYLALLDEVGRP